ncbi:MAG: UDP-4-amino-4-deoxy-L-arabinose aminotransferase [Sphingomonadales bacterium]
MKVPFFRHALGSADADRIAAVLATPYLTAGDVGRQVEAQIAEFFGQPHAALTSSWTLGAIASLMALGIGPGDEVIVPAMTFAATANVVEMVGARPVFVDVDPETLLLTPEAAAAAIGPRTRAIIAVHLYGRMADMAGLSAMLVGRDDIALIEDCAHCFEGMRDGARPGAFSDVAIFSFYATKNITCGEGGCVVTRRPDLHAALLQIRSQGMTASAIDRFRNQVYHHWDMERLGLKAVLPDLLAALLGPQIETIAARLPAREALARRYQDRLGGLPLRWPASVPGVVDARHLFVIHVAPRLRDPLMLALNEAGIATTVNYRAVPSLRYYRQKYGYAAGAFPVAEHWGEGAISLPFYPGMGDAAQDHVMAQLAALLAQDRFQA